MPPAVQRALVDYIRFGGFPEVVLAKDERRKELSVPAQRRLGTRRARTPMAVPIEPARRHVRSWHRGRM